MGKYWCRAAIIFSILALMVFVTPLVSFAGIGFKEKVQQKISQSNVNVQRVLNANDEIQAQSADFEMDCKNEITRGAYAPQIEQAKPTSMLASRERAVDNFSPFVSSYAIYQTDYKAELEESVVTVNGKVIFEVFQKGRAQLPLASSSVGLINVSVNKGAAFVTTQAGRYYLVVDKPGKYTLNIEFLIKASRERENGPGSFSFDVIPAPISQFEFIMPETGVEIFVEPAIKVEVRKEKESTAAWAIMPNTATIMTRWTKALPKEEIQPVVLEPKVYLNAETFTAIGEGVVRCWSTLNFSILQSEVSNFRMSMPEDVSVLNVTGGDLRDWKVSKDKGVQYLDVYLNYGVKGNYVLNVNYERSIGAGSVVAEIPALKTLGVERESGYFGIAASTNVELAVNKIAGVTAVDVKELPSSIWGRSTSPILLAMKYLNHPFEIAIDVTRHEEIPVLIAAVDVADYVSLYTEEGKVLTKATYQVRNNVKQYLRFSLPKGATLWSAFVAGQPVKPAKDKNGSILIPLQKSQRQGESLTQFPVEVVYLDQGSKMKLLGQLKINLPRTDVPVSELRWTAYFPNDYTYFKFGGNVKKSEVRFSPLAVVGGVAREAKQVSGRVQLGEQFDSTTQYSSQYEPYRMEGQQADAAKGKLPIKIDVPEQGRSLQFSKLLVTEEESPWLSLYYSSIPNKLSVLFRLLVAAVLIVVLVRILRKNKK